MKWAHMDWMGWICCVVSNKWFAAPAHDAEQWAQQINGQKRRAESCHGTVCQDGRDTHTFAPFSGATFDHENHQA